ncbi:hypothetical protein DPMN_157437 [Dreissena polymorpha]|uniref:Uncharacterized protein n=1 Tax=Dreissena polymorpha TaxID=45954 RepID=A0A9D4EH86_DREPO|nr:hypothetical protein DPMN_157437 [Dreissena polymorpha]
MLTSHNGQRTTDKRRSQKLTMSTLCSEMESNRASQALVAKRQLVTPTKDCYLDANSSPPSPLPYSAYKKEQYVIPHVAGGRMRVVNKEAVRVVNKEADQQTARSRFNPVAKTQL